jgi:D-3-phosphoglycerate dehydrogenase
MGVGGAGYDTIDIDACTEAGILVVNQSGIGSEAVAEHVIGMMLGLSKRIVLADRALRSGADYHRHDFRGNDIKGQTVGVVGFGNIGSRVGEICRTGFSMRVLAHDPYLGDGEIRERGGEPFSLDDLLRQSDFVSVNTPLSAQTTGLIGLRELRLMKPTSFYITTARGEVTDERALIQVMNEGAIAGAGVDVWDPEPPSPDNPLLKMDNVIACPHVAGVTMQAHHDAEVSGAHQWIGIFRGERPPRLQNPDVWPRYRERYRKVTGDDPAE